METIKRIKRKRNRIINQRKLDQIIAEKNIGKDSYVIRNQRVYEFIIGVTTNQLPIFCVNSKP
jgi:hypothetical protein